ncbi:MAG: hypothetical protein AAF999_11445 [Pseudomonadota bacterium]
MQNDYWVIAVLTDLGDFAGNRGYSRLHAAMETAREEFLKDVETSGSECASGLRRNTKDTASRQASSHLGKKHDL